LGDRATRPFDLRPAHRDERGSAVVVAVLAMAILTVLFVGALNFVLDEYAKGAARTAADDAAQAGASAGGSVAACVGAAEKAFSDLVPGPFGRDVRFTCTVEGTNMVAMAQGTLPSFVPVVPRLGLSVLGISVVQAAPTQ
jgi:hypothetical protein